MSDRQTPDTEVVRHFTATGFVVSGGSIALHWHPKVRAWLPPGGHIEPNEDPAQAVVREALEETGLSVEVVSTAPALGLSYPEQVAPPCAIMVEDIHDPTDGFHKHIDMIYFCRPTGNHGALARGWQWVSRAALQERQPLTDGANPAALPPEDVRLLGLRAIEWVEGGLAREREERMGTAAQT